MNPKILLIGDWFFNNKSKLTVQPFENWELQFCQRMQDGIDAENFDLIFYTPNENGSIPDHLIEWPNAMAIQNEIDDNLADLHQVIAKNWQLDTSNLDMMVGEDQEAMLEFLEFSFDELEKNLISLCSSYEKSDVSQVKFFSHKLNSKINILLMPCSMENKFLEENVSLIEQKEWKDNYAIVKKISLLYLSLLKSKILQS